MKSNILKAVFTLLFFTALFVACEDDPTSLGLENIPPEDLIGLYEINSIDSMMLQKASYYNASLVDTAWNMGTSIRIHVGKKDDIVSKMLIVFRSNVADTTAAYFEENEITINKAWVELKPRSLLGDSTANFDLTVSKINTNWSSSLFSKDSLDKILPSTEHVSISPDITDSLIKFEIPNELAREWIEGSINDSTELNNGLLFEPTSGTNKILGFYSLHEDNIADGYEYIPVTKIEIAKSGWSKMDTLNFYSFRDVHVLTEGYPQQNNDYIYVQCGIPIRANYYIDVSVIPENAIIVDAVLDFYYDPQLTLNGSSASKTINLLMYADSTAKTLLTGTRILSLVKDSVENKYSGHITSAVQLWRQGEINNGADNQGVFVYAIDEEYNLNRLVFYGPQYSDELLRPKLTVKYSKR